MKENQRRDQKRRRLAFSMMAVILIFTACGKKYKNPAEAPFASERCVGMDYNDAMGQLKAAGFTEINTEDVSTRRADEDGKVASITINQETKYELGKVWENNVPVMVKYYELAKYLTELDMEIEGDAGKPEFLFTTSLPDKTELTITMTDGDAYTKQQIIKVKDGKAKTQPFHNHYEPLVGEYTLTCTMDAQDQPYGVRLDLGSDGDCMVGEFIQEEEGKKCLYFEYAYLSDYIPPERTPQEELDTMLRELLDMGIKDQYYLTLEGDTYILDTWQEGIAITATLARMGEQTSMAAWEGMRKAAEGLSVSMCNILENCGHKEKRFIVNIVNDINPDLILLSATLGVTTYDFVAEK